MARRLLLFRPMKKLTWLAILFCGALFAQQAQGPLTNRRIADLLFAGVRPEEIIRIISTAPQVSFDLRPVETDALMKAGISEEIIKVMAARENGVPFTASAPNMPRTYPAVVRTTPIVPMPSAAPVPSTAPVPPVLPVVRPISGPSAILYQGTPVRMRIMRTVSSADAQVGNNVDFQTLDDIAQNGVVIIPKGSTAIATITAAESKKRVARGGKLGMNIDYVRLPSGEQLALRGVQNLKGGGHTGAMTGAIVATAIVFWPAAPFFLFMHGKDVTIPEGHEVTVYTNTDYRFSTASF